MDETKNTGINLLISAFPGLSVQKTVGPRKEKSKRREANRFHPLEKRLPQGYESDSSSDATTTTLGITSGADRSSDAEKNGGPPRRKQFRKEPLMRNPMFMNQEAWFDYYESESDMETEKNSDLPFRLLGGYNTIMKRKPKIKPEGSGSSAAETSGDTTVHEGQIEGSSGEETES